MKTYRINNIYYHVLWYVVQMPSSVALKISANSTRRARWYTKLGYCKESWPFAVPLNSVHGSGGIITRTKAFVLRVYPLVYVVKEKTEDGQRTGNIPILYERHAYS